MSRAAAVPAALAVLLFVAGCGPKAAPAAAGVPTARPAVVDRAVERIEDPLAGVSRVRALVKIVKPGGPDAGTASWGGWIPVDGKTSADGEQESLGDLDMVLSMLRARTMVAEVLAARPYAWSKESGSFRGRATPGGFVSVRLDDAKRITFVRSDAPYHPRALDIRYDGDSGWVREIDAKDEDIELAIRWTRREDGLLDVDAGIAVTGTPAQGEVHVRILELDPPKPASR